MNPNSKRMKDLEEVGRWVVFAILVTLLMSVFLGCSRKVVTLTDTQTVIDTTAVLQLTKENSALRKTVMRQHKEKVVIERELATLQKGTLQKDPILPVKEFRVSSGNAYFEAEYQGLINNYSFYIPKRESVESTKSDSTAYLQEQLTLTRDSFLYYKNRDILKTLVRHTVEAPGWWQRLWIAFKMFWWVIVLALCFGIFVGWRVLP